MLSCGALASWKGRSDRVMTFQVLSVDRAPLQEAAGATPEFANLQVCKITVLEGVTGSWWQMSKQSAQM